MSSIFACDLGLNRKTLSRNFFCCFVFRFREIFFNQHWRQMRASLILLFGKTKAFFGKDTARKKTAFLHTLFVENERETSKLKWGAMFFYKVEGHMPKLSSFGRGKNFRPKKSLTSLLDAALQMFLPKYYAGSHLIAPLWSTSLCKTLFAFRKHVLLQAFQRNPCWTELKIIQAREINIFLFGMAFCKFKQNIWLLWKESSIELTWASSMTMRTSSSKSSIDSTLNTHTRKQTWRLWTPVKKVFHKINLDIQTGIK